MELFFILYVDYFLLLSFRDGEFGIVVFVLELLFNSLINKSIVNFYFFLKCRYIICICIRIYRGREFVRICTCMCCISVKIMIRLELRYDVLVYIYYMLYCIIFVLFVLK